MQLVGLGDGDVLLLRVDHEDRVRWPVQSAQASEVAIELLELALVGERLLLRHGGEVAGVAGRFELDELANPAGDRLEVGQHAPEPALVDVRHPTRGCEFGDRVLRLLLGTDEEDHSSAGNEISHVGIGGVDAFQGLVQVDDVDSVALAEDEALHLRVPAAGLMPEMDTGLEQLFHRDDGHVVLPPDG